MSVFPPIQPFSLLLNQPYQNDISFRWAVRFSCSSRLATIRLLHVPFVRLDGILGGLQTHFVLDESIILVHLLLEFWPRLHSALGQCGDWQSLQIGHRAAFIVISIADDSQIHVAVSHVLQPILPIPQRSESSVQIRIFQFRFVGL